MCASKTSGSSESWPKLLVKALAPSIFTALLASGLSTWIYSFIKEEGVVDAINQIPVWYFVAISVASFTIILWWKKSKRDESVDHFGSPFVLLNWDRTGFYFGDDKVVYAVYASYIRGDDWFKYLNSSNTMIAGEPHCGNKDCLTPLKLKSIGGVHLALCPNCRGKSLRIGSWHHHFDTYQRILAGRLNNGSYQKSLAEHHRDS